MLLRPRYRVAIIAALLAPLASAGPSRGATPPPLGAIEHIGHQLFTAIDTNNVAAANRLFFPESAYLRMKTGRINNPSSDYVNRLAAFYTLDVRAYHALVVGPQPATYVRTDVDVAAQQWIPVGVCENAIGYWYMPRLRLVYRQRGVLKSFGIQSLISWHNHYYIIHLGPNPRPVNVGTVLTPQRGPGTPGPGGGC